MTYATRRAVFWTIVGIIGGIICWVATVSDWRASLPLGIFFAFLILNTYPSLRLFSSLVPMEDGKHALADLMIALIYVFLAASFADPQRFALCATVLFLVAAGKYGLMLYDIPHPKLLERKIRVDLLGALLCCSVLAAMNAGYVFQASWFLAIIFALANVYVLMIRPLYRL
jgi:hypothetical protein